MPRRAERYDSGWKTSTEVTGPYIASRHVEEPRANLSLAVTPGPFALSHKVASHIPCNDLDIII